MSLADRQKWDTKYEAADGIPSQPSAVLQNLARFLPTSGSALDIAGGAGRNALWLASRGLEVTLWDVSPVGLKLARDRARLANLRLNTVEVDLETSTALPSARFDVVVSVCYLYRPLLARLRDVLKPGGTLVMIQPTLRNLEKNDKPPKPFLLAERELPGLTPGLEIVHYEEGWLADGRHDAILVARKPAPGDV